MRRVFPAASSLGGTSHPGVNSLKFNMELGESNYQEAVSALKDILYMFVDAVVQDGDFSELFLGSFNPFDFLEVKDSSQSISYMSDGEIDLLMKGAAITLLATIADVYFDDECHAANEEEKKKYGMMPNFIANNEYLPESHHFSYLTKIYDIYKSGKYIDNKYIENAFAAAFRNEDDFYRSMKIVLKKVIIPSYKILSEFKN